MNEFLDTHWIDPERFLGYNKIVYGGVMLGEKIHGLVIQKRTASDKDIQIFTFHNNGAFLFHLLSS